MLEKPNRTRPQLWKPANLRFYHFISQNITVSSNAENYLKACRRRWDRALTRSPPDRIPSSSASNTCSRTFLPPEPMHLITLHTRSRTMSSKPEARWLGTGGACRDERSEKGMRKKSRAGPPMKIVRRTAPLAGPTTTDSTANTRDSTEPAECNRTDHAPSAAHGSVITTWAAHWRTSASHAVRYPPRILGLDELGRWDSKRPC